jgi:hypothetical protein
VDAIGLVDGLAGAARQRGRGVDVMAARPVRAQISVSPVEPDDVREIFGQ